MSQQSVPPAVAPAVLQPSANLGIAIRAAGEALAAVARGRALDDALRLGASGLAAAERAAAQSIAYGAVRRLNLLDALATSLLKRPNPKIDFIIRAALSELLDHPARAHTVVDQSVAALEGSKHHALRGVVNGVLRTFLREKSARLERANRSEAIRHALPQWWLDRLRQDWPERWQSIVEAGNQPPAMTLRVNRRRASVASCQQQLRAAGIACEQTGPDALTLARPQPLASLPGYAAGELSAQDAGAQWAAHLLDVNPGMRVLDACAAPGGKAAHILEQCECNLLALDKDAERLRPTLANFERLGLSASIQAADAAVLDSWWNGTPFDRILLDAPCTASGVIARHPDGKWLKRPADMENLARLQRTLLDALWRVLRPGGKLLYATCSVFQTENVRQIETFVKSHADASSMALVFDQRFAPAHVNGQLFPDAQQGGFYYALLAKD